MNPLETLVAALKEALKDVKPAEVAGEQLTADALVARALREANPGAWQTVHDVGLANGREKGTADKTKLEADLVTARKEAKDAKDALKAAEDGNADLAARRAQFEKAEKEANERAEKAEAQLKEVREGVALDASVRTLVDALSGTTDGRKTNPAVLRDYAELLVLRPDIRARLKVQEDGTVVVLKAGTTDVPLLGNGTRTAFDLLADEITPTVREDFIAADSAGGAGGGKGGSGGGASGSALDRAAAAGKADREAEAPPKDAPSVFTHTSGS